MRADSEVLVLEDDPEQMNLIKGAVQRADLVPLDALNPRKALARLHYHRPVLAVIDLDMSKAERTEKTVNDVLERLYEQHGECITLVYSYNVSTIVQQDKVIGVHPMALFQDKNDGEEALVRRINRLLTARFGDLIIDKGVVKHEPSGKTYRHRVAVSLVMAKRSHQDVPLDESASKAARRFKAWLVEVGSMVDVATRGHKHYGLEKRPQPEPA